MKNLFKGFAVFIALTVLYFIAVPKQSFTFEEKKDFDAFVETLIHERGIPGLSVAVIQNGVLVKSEGYGFADMEMQRPMTSDTPINIASISKPIMGIALLQLKDKGMLDLDADINDYLDFEVKNPNVANGNITLRDLATHTSGINDYYSEEEFTPNIDAPQPLGEFVASLLTPAGSKYNNGEHYLETHAGEQRLYSNLGAGVAGHIAENMGGEHLGDMMERTVFSPLGMNNTSWRLDDFSTNQLAVRYEVGQCARFLQWCADGRHPKSAFVIGKLFNPEAKRNHYTAYPQYGNPNYPDGGVHASAKDLAILTQTILNKGVHEGYTLLSPASFEEMLRLQLPPEMSTRQRFFWRDNSTGMTGHMGSDLGILSALYFDMQKGNAIIVLINRTPDAGTMSALKSVYERVYSNYF